MAGYMRSALLVLAAGGAIHVACLNLHRESFARQNLMAASNHLPPPGFEQLRRVDQLVNDLTPSGNLLLRFNDFQPANPSDEELISHFYYRAVYALWPRRIYVATPDHVINGGADLMRIDFSPDSDWLRAHDVRAVVQMIRDTGGYRIVTHRLE